MALLDFLKKSKKDGTLQAPKQGSLPGARTAGQAPKAKEKTKRVELHKSSIAWRLLREPHVTEKATRLTRLNQYVFLVYDVAVKPEVKRAIEEVYGVHVTKVRKVVIPRKKRMRGRHIGWRSGYTKAIVTLKKGEKIEVLPH